MSTAAPLDLDYVSRRALLGAEVVRRGLDAALVTSAVNVTYLTGLVSSNAACLVRPDGGLTLATDARYAQMAHAWCPEAEVFTERHVAAALLGRAVQPGERVGVEREHLTWARGLALAQQAEGVLELVDLTGAVESLRAVKEVAEVALLAQAGEISVRALAVLLDGPVQGRTERALARDLEAQMLLLGADGLAFDTIVASGPNGAVPHHAPGDRRVQRGDLLTIDFGAKVAGYHADCTRTVAVGMLGSDWQEPIYHLVAAAQQAGIDALAPGMSTEAVDAAARTLIDDAGYGESFVHGLGHGVGLEIHEPPWLSAADPPAGTLGLRTTITVEPGIYLPGEGGVRIEDTMDVGPAGVRVLTDMTKELLIVDG